MKKNLKITKFFTLIAFLGIMASCSSDSSGGLDDVPSGEIVALAERQITLTGFSDSPQNSETQKWWTHVISKATISGPDECGEDVTVNSQGYFAFYANGGLYYKTSKSGSPTYAGSWEWANSSKSSITVNSSLGQQDFTVTYLNATNVVYGSTQSEGPCSAVTYEKFNEPFFE